MFPRKEIIPIDKIDSTPIEINDQKSLEVFYLQKQLAGYEAYRQMMVVEKNTEDYQRLRKDWLAKRKEVENEEKRFKENMPADIYEDYVSDYNLSRARAEERLRELGDVEPAQKQEQDSPVERTEQSGDKKWRSLWGLGAGEKLPKDVTEADVRKYIEMKKSSLSTLAQAYAENLLNDLYEQPEREKAEERRDEVEKLETEEKEVEERLGKEKRKAVGVFDEPNDREISRLEKKFEEKQGKAKEKKQGLGEKFKKGVKRLFSKFKRQKTKKESELAKLTRMPGEEFLKHIEVVEVEEGNAKSGNYKKVGGFFTERAKGFVGGFGWWESHQAEKFRLGTKEAGLDAKAQVKLLEQEAGLMDFDMAREEGSEVEGRLAEKKIKNRIAYERLSNKISGEKQEYNQKTEDKIVALAMAKLEENIGGKEWFRAYKAANGGRALTPEKAQELERRMREEIGRIRMGQTDKDLFNFVKLTRQSLDKWWWSRYVYTGIDAILAGLLLKWIISKYTGGKAMAGAEKITAKGGEKVVVKGAEEVAETGLKDTIWGEAKRMLIKEGVANPANAQIQQVATEIAKDSGVKVISKASGEIIWQQTAGGVARDIALGKGFLLKLGGAVKKIAMIKAAL